MSVKFLVLGGGGILVWGGGECRFYFYGRVDFSDTFRSLGLLRIRIGVVPAHQIF